MDGVALRTDGAGVAYGPTVLGQHGQAAALHGVLGGEVILRYACAWGEVGIRVWEGGVEVVTEWLWEASISALAPGFRCGRRRS